MVRRRKCRFKNKHRTKKEVETEMRLSKMFETDRRKPGRLLKGARLCALVLRAGTSGYL